MSRLPLATAWLLAATVTSGLAQTPDELARLARLERRAAELAARRARADSMAEIRHDTVRVGPILLLTDSAASPVLSETLTLLRHRTAEALGTPFIEPLRNAVIVVRFGTPNPAWGRLVTDGAQFVQVTRDSRQPPRLTRALVHAVGQILQLRGGTSLQSWRADLRLFEDPDAVLAATFVELHVNSLPNVRRCAEGDLAACRYTLRLTAPDDTAPPGEMPGLPAFVEQRYHWRANEPALATAYAGCVHRRQSDTCVEFLDLIDTPLPSVSNRALGSVVRVALDRGGDGALARFLADTAAAIPARLEAAAGVPLDTLLSLWRETVRSHRPPATTVPSSLRWLAVGWTVLFAALATRSTQWR